MSDNDDNERLQIRAELANMSFEELQKLKEKLGSKVYNEAVFEISSKVRTKKTPVFKRENKNRPREMTSKKPVPLLDTKSTAEKEIRDPRFDSLCGTYNPKAFKRSYSFLSDIKQGELRLLKKELNKTDDFEEQKKIKYLIQRFENQNREEIINNEKKEKKNQEYQERVQLIKEGNKPVFVKKSDKKIINLVEQYEELKKSGKLEKHITKRRKKNSQKARKKMNVM